MSDEVQTLVTEEIQVIMHGVVYDAILIPRVNCIEVDFPRTGKLTSSIKKMTEEPLLLGQDFTFVPDEDGGSYRLTPETVKRLLALM